ncbi:DUF928 domain-containing protein [Sphaerothrix gracilis]|uniref:DUF928 domain-containing protein n=1 Tax=Sphaerothrix gracilis TaxID=3151835 RepID=UPI0031FBEB96
MPHWCKLSTSFLTSLSVVALASSVQAGLSFNSPDLQAPGNREAGASRSDDNCLVAADSRPDELVALIPNTNMGLTTEAAPTFYVYVPPNRGETLEFLLYEAGTNRLVYQESYEPQASSGQLLAVDLPADGQHSLAVGQDYYWYFSVVCSQAQPDENLVVESNIRRIAPTAELSQQLAAARPQDRPAIYAGAGVWYETLEALAAVEPDYTSLQWRSLLQSVGLEELADTVALKN